MKPTVLLAGAVMIASSAMAQNEHLYLFRNDKDFDFYKLSDITEIQYTGGTSGFSRMVITTPTGTETHDMSAIDSCVIRTAALPDFHINLTEYPDITDLFKDNGFTKSTIYPATLRMDGNGMYDDLEEQSVEFRGRGNSTWMFAKTPYRFKMSKKRSVCDMPKAKTFALIANYIDPSLMRNAVALWTADQLGLPFTNHCVPVNVYLNGYYKGAYILTEKIGIGGGSVDLDETTGMLFELDSNYDEDFKFVYTFPNDRKKILPVMVKDPDLTEIKTDAAEREAYFNEWVADFTEMATTVLNPGNKKLSNYIDLNDAAKYVLVNSLACNRELSHPKSLYIHKAALGSSELYHFGPVWDFDWAYGYEGTESFSYDRLLFAEDGACAGASFMKKLVSNAEFKAVYKEIWDDFYANIYPRLLVYMENYANLIEPTAKRDGLLWPDAWAAGYAKAESSYDTKMKVGELTDWVKGRVEWCNNHANLGLY